MTCIRVLNGIACIGGPTKCISVGGKDYYFEMHPFCGPMSCTVDGDGKKDPGPRHPFWKAVTLWDQQGRQEKDGKCVYDPDKEVVPILKHLGGRQYEVVGHETVGERRRRLQREPHEQTPAP